MQLKANGQKNLRQNKINKKFVYLISPNKIPNINFYNDLALVLSSKKISFFQLRLKKETNLNKLIIGKKIKKICNKYKVKFLINDDPLLAKKLNADGCHLGQKDMDLIKARKILKNKITQIYTIGGYDSSYFSDFFRDKNCIKKQHINAILSVYDITSCNFI